jgi:hypothetical protein
MPASRRFAALVRSARRNLSQSLAVLEESEDRIWTEVSGAVRTGPIFPVPAFAACHSRLASVFDHLLIRPFCIKQYLNCSCFHSCKNGTEMF